MNGLKVLVYLIAVIVFIIILIKKKVLSFLKKNIISENEDSLSANGMSPLSERGKKLCYEVLAFGTYDKPDSKEFADRIELQLEYELTKLANKQTVYHVDYVPVGSMLVLFISYEV